MKLRTRLALTLFLTATVLILLIGWAQQRWHEAFRTDAVTETIRYRMQSGGKANCEAAPETWPRFEEPMHHSRARRRGRRRGRWRPPPLEHRVFAYDAAFESRNRKAPRFPEELKALLQQGDEVAVRDIVSDRTRRGPPHPMSELAISMPWQDGPCAIVLVRVRGGSGFLSASTLLPAWLVSLAAIFAVLLVAGPIVRRIRRLTTEVQRTGAPVTIDGSDEVTELARAFDSNRHTIQQQVASLENQKQTLKDYIANTTHDVMLPLTVLQGHLVALQQRIQSGDQVSGDALVPCIEEAHYIGSLLHNLNAAARLESPDMHRNPVDLCRLVERVTERHQPVARRKGVALAFAVSPETVTFDGDLTLLEQALSNIVHNAVRYNRSGGHVAVTLSGSDAAWTIRIADDGPGVSEQERTKVTERAYRGADAQQRFPHGTGLGLHIANDVLTRHGLRFRLSETEGGGLTVEFGLDDG